MNRTAKSVLLGAVCAAACALAASAKTTHNPLATRTVSTDLPTPVCPPSNPHCAVLNPQK